MQRISLKLAAAKGSHKDQPDKPPNLRPSRGAASRCATCKHYQGTLMESTCTKFKWAVQPNELCDDYEPQEFTPPDELPPNPGDMNPFTTGMQPGVPLVPKMAKDMRMAIQRKVAMDLLNSGQIAPARGINPPPAVNQTPNAAAGIMPKPKQPLLPAATNLPAQHPHHVQAALQHQAKAASQQKAAQTKAAAASAPGPTNVGQANAAPQAAPPAPQGAGTQGQQGQASQQPQPPMGGFKPSVVAGLPQASSRPDVTAGAMFTGADPNVASQGMQKMGRVACRDKLAFSMAAGRPVDAKVLASVMEAQTAPGVDLFTRLENSFQKLSRHIEILSSCHSVPMSCHPGELSSCFDGYEKAPQHQLSLQHHSQHLTPQGLSKYGEMTAGSAPVYGSSSGSRSQGTVSRSPHDSNVPKPRVMGELSGDVPMRQQVPADAMGSRTLVETSTKFAAHKALESLCPDELRSFPEELSKNLLKLGDHDSARVRRMWLKRQQRRGDSSLGRPNYAGGAHVEYFKGASATGLTSLQRAMGMGVEGAARAYGHGELGSATLMKTGVATPCRAAERPLPLSFEVSVDGENAYRKHASHLFRKVAQPYTDTAVPFGGTPPPLTPVAPMAAPAGPTAQPAAKPLGSFPQRPAGLGSRGPLPDQVKAGGPNPKLARAKRAADVDMGDMVCKDSGSLGRDFYHKDGRKLTFFNQASELALQEDMNKKYPHGRGSNNVAKGLRKSSAAPFLPPMNNMTNLLGQPSPHGKMMAPQLAAEAAAKAAKAGKGANPAPPAVAMAPATGANPATGTPKMAASAVQGGPLGSNKTPASKFALPAALLYKLLKPSAGSSMPSTKLAATVLPQNQLQAPQDLRSSSAAAAAPQQSQPQAAPQVAYPQEPPPPQKQMPPLAQRSPMQQPQRQMPPLGGRPAQRPVSQRAAGAASPQPKTAAEVSRVVGESVVSKDPGDSGTQKTADGVAGPGRCKPADHQRPGGDYRCPRCGCTWHEPTCAHCGGKNEKIARLKTAYEDHSKINTLPRKSIVKQQLPLHPQPDPHRGNEAIVTAKQGSWSGVLFGKEAFGLMAGGPAYNTTQIQWPTHSMSKGPIQWNSDKYSRNRADMNDWMKMGIDEIATVAAERRLFDMIKKAQNQYNWEQNYPDPEVRQRNMQREIELQQQFIREQEEHMRNAPPEQQAHHAQQIEQMKATVQQIQADQQRMRPQQPAAPPGGQPAAQPAAPPAGGQPPAAPAAPGAPRVDNAAAAAATNEQRSPDQQRNALMTNHEGALSAMAGMTREQAAELMTGLPAQQAMAKLQGMTPEQIQQTYGVAPVAAQVVLGQRGPIQQAELGQTPEARATIQQGAQSAQQQSQAAARGYRPEAAAQQGQPPRGPRQIVSAIRPGGGYGQLTSGEGGNMNMEHRFKRQDEAVAQLQQVRQQRDQMNQQYQAIRNDPARREEAQQMYQQLRQLNYQARQAETRSARVGWQTFSADERDALRQGALGAARANPRTYSPEERAAISSGDVGALSRIRDRTDRGLNVDMSDMGAQPQWNRELAKTDPDEYRRQQQAYNNWNKTYRERRQAALQQQQNQGGGPPAPAGAPAPGGQPPAAGQPPAGAQPPAQGPQPGNQPVAQPPPAAPGAGGQPPANAPRPGQPPAGTPPANQQGGRPGGNMAMGRGTPLRTRGGQGMNQVAAGMPQMGHGRRQPGQITSGPGPRNPGGNAAGGNAPGGGGNP